MTNQRKSIRTTRPARCTRELRRIHTATSAIATAIVSTASLMSSSLPARAEMSGGFKNIYSNKTCYRNDIPARCDVYYSPKDVTWRVHWRGTGEIEFYLRRGGNMFEIRNSYGDDIGTAELMPAKQILRLIRQGGATIGTVKIFDLQ